MPFATRNVYHLRLSAHSVLPLYVYLDERHVEWMTNRTLQLVLADLQSLILPKLQAGYHAGLANSKKSTVDVHRGDHYQFAFFVRKVDSQSNVLIKTRRFVQAQAMTKRGESPVTLGKRKRKLESGIQPITSIQQRRPNDEAEIVDESEDDINDPDFVADDDEEEEKKMNLHLSFQGFSILGRCLCVVIEPYPSLNSSSETHSEMPQTVSKVRLLQAHAGLERTFLRGETPLFLPESESGRSSAGVSSSSLMPPPLLSESMELLAQRETHEGQAGMEGSGMMALTQLLQTSALYRIDNDSDGEEAGVFMGDPEASRDIF